MSNEVTELISRGNDSTDSGKRRTRVTDQQEENRRLQPVDNAHAANVNLLRSDVPSTTAMATPSYALPYPVTPTVNKIPQKSLLKSSPASGDVHKPPVLETPYSSSPLLLDTTKSTRLRSQNSEKRATRGCFTCRTRRKECDEMFDNQGSCRTCLRLRI
ncbi:hypothetical protein JAAARDRAFT_56864 [Jaapia argillacea MUCL 33604]|uniref:Zn(2)-C6 fungal-type domain-containing protein n=1 Tax=Jaapia argillacea MUCL 33604 TaxID=933084 RepID=A0A067PZ36_9AGAM|nr:hypothetical protein JAAARDRAFT_56864 [Jaapia argillacea MUCL 33604]